MTTEHVTAPKTSLIVFLVLMALLVATVVAAGIEHAVVGLIVALAIASFKTVLIIVYFMNIRFSDSVTRIASAAGFVGLAILLALTFSDYLSRAPDQLRDQSSRAATARRGIDNPAAKASHAD